MPRAYVLISRRALFFNHCITSHVAKHHTFVVEPLRCMCLKMCISTHSVMGPYIV